MPKRKLSTRIFVLLILIYAIFLACLKIDRPGFYYDELLFMNAATGAKTNLFIARRIFGIPILLMKYIGALKSWIYYPIFSFFPVNAWTIRLPSIIIGTAGGLGLVIALRRGFGPAAALAGAVMILLDPTLLIHSRLDWGPNALMFFFRGALVLSLVQWIRTRNPGWVWPAITAILLGVFDKLNFLWFAFAALGSLAFFYTDMLLDFARTRPRQAALAGSILAAALAITTVRSIRLAEHMDISWPQRISYAAWLIRMTSSGGAALDFISGDGLRVEQWFWPGYLLAIALAAIGCRSLIRLPAERRLYGWLLALFLLLTTAFVLTKTATGSQHSSMLSGIWQMLLAPLIGAFWDDPATRQRRIRSIAAPVALALVFIGSTATTLININAFARPANHNWDPANAKAAAFAKQKPGAVFLTSDWGIGNLLVASAADRSAVMDYWPLFTREEKADSCIKSMPGNKDIYIFTHLPGFENFKGNRTNLSAALEKNHILHEVVMTYPNWQGVPMIEIWKIHL